MKLLNEEGRFQLVKNSIVKIDNTLPKYKKLEAIKSAKSELGAEDYYNHVNAYQTDNGMVTVTDESSNTTRFIVPETIQTENGPERVIRGTLVQDILGPDVDECVRDTVTKIGSGNLRKFLTSKDAEEFNKEFMPILSAEKSRNSGDLIIPTSRWTENEGSYVYCSPNEISASKTGFFEDVKKLYNNIKNAVVKTNKDKEEQEAALHVVDFFDLIHVEGGKEREFVDRLDGYFKLIRNAAIMHQDAQLDELCQGVIIHVYEAVLATHGYNKFIKFGDLEKMNSSGKKVVDIDYIKDFGRVIPNDVVEKKLHCDSLCVFDNYCVMYYDPTGATYKVPTAAKRDPILFGLINHSDKLYYIGDWIDDKCDLTLEKVAELCSIGDLDTGETSEPVKTEKKKTKRSKKK